MLVSYLIVAVFAWLAGLTSLNDLRANFDPISTFAILISWIAVVAAAIFLAVTYNSWHIIFLVIVYFILFWFGQYVWAMVSKYK